MGAKRPAPEWGRARWKERSEPAGTPALPGQARRRRRVVARANVPVVLLSAKGAVDQRLEGLQAGANDYLAKPFSVPELLHRLRARLPERCLTSEESRAGGETSEAKWAERLEACIAERMGEQAFDVEGLARAVGYSPRQLRRRVVVCYGMSPAALLLDRRLKRAQELIKGRRHETVAQVAHAVGLSAGYFSRRYRQAFGCDEIKL